MQLQSDAKLLRIFIGEYDKVHSKPLSEEIVMSARKAGMAGATVLRGIMDFGANSRIHSVKLLIFHLTANCSRNYRDRRKDQRVYANSRSVARTSKLRRSSYD